MPLAESYVRLLSREALAGGYILPRSDKLRSGYADWFGAGDAGVRLPGFRTLRGRRNVAIPSGLTLPAASGGIGPYSYSASGLPGGVSFAAATRTLSGTPSAAGTSTVTYGVSDSSTPALTASKTFEWSVLDLITTAGLMLQDFDSGALGYGLSSFNPVYAAALVSGANLGFVNAQIWAGPPRTAVGSVVDDPLQDRLLPTGAIVSRVDWRPQANPDQFRLFDSDQDLDGNAVVSDIGQWGQDNPDLNLYLQATTGAPGLTFEFDNDFDHGAVWHLTFTADSAAGTWLRANITNGGRFLLVIA